VGLDWRADEQLNFCEQNQSSSKMELRYLGCYNRIDMNATLQSRISPRWLIVVVYAIAMAWVESAVVYYLRTQMDRMEPYQLNPLPEVGGFGPVEGIRELATMVMLLTVGMLAGRNWRARIGYSVVAFGVWDIFYYVFLKAICGWPHSLADWDILFLLPLPWWGPVWAPMAIALLMIIWGTLASEFEADNSIRPLRRLWLLNFCGMAMALYVFMADCLHALHGGVDAIRTVLPTHFNSTIFCVALLLMAAPVIHLSWRIWSPGLKRNRNLAVQENYSCKGNPQT
jgi:hypothetical protein